MLDDRQRALATVDLSAVRHNIAYLVSLLPAGAALCAVVKADGYGHGAVPVARAALQAGASWLGWPRSPRSKSCARRRSPRRS